MMHWNGFDHISVTDSLKCMLHQNTQLLKHCPSQYCKGCLQVLYCSTCILPLFDHVPDDILLNGFAKEHTLKEKVYTND